MTERKAFMTARELADIENAMKELAALCANLQAENAELRARLDADPTAEMIEAGAKAAWMNYTGRDTDDEWMLECLPDTWPETGLYPEASHFRLAAEACFLAMRRRP